MSRNAFEVGSIFLWSLALAIFEGAPNFNLRTLGWAALAAVTTFFSASIIYGFKRRTK